MSNQLNDDFEKVNKKKKKSFLNTLMLVITLFLSIIYFIFIIVNKNSSIINIVNSLFIVLFTIIYLMICIKVGYKNKLMIFFSSLFLLGFFISNILVDKCFLSTSLNEVDFRGKTLTDLVKWTKKNNITLEQDYEYSDMVDEYKIISQEIRKDKNKITSISVSISEGPNPSKEIVVPSMISWDAERVINFVISNHLNNVNVEFVESDKLKDTVIEQNKSGNLKRDDELKLTFSYGDEGNSNEVKLIDFSNKSKFEIEFFMKQHHLNYNFEYDFSSKVRKGFAIKQSVKAGEVVNTDDKSIIITLSKGPKIKVPDITDMSLEDITEWAVKNKLKLEFIDKYDDTIKEGNIISIDKEKDEVVEEGTTIKVTLSCGKLKMPKFNSVDDFYDWANKYEIKYEVKHEFSSSVDAGEVISYSVKAGQSLKNDEAITVIISDGKNCEVPDLKGLSKSEATSRLKKSDLNYNFVYKNSDKAKDKVISQSISSGSEISCGTSITVTLSNGKKEESIVEKRKEDNSSTNNNTSNTSSNSSSSNSSSNNSSKNTKPSTPEKVCNSCTIIPSELKNVISQSVRDGGGYQGTADVVVKFIKDKCPGISVNVSGDTTSGKSPGMVVPGSWSGGETDSCKTVNIILAK